jgi:hypothetical protein
MAEVQFKFGWPGSQITYNVAAAVTGGQVVERTSAARTVTPAGAGSTKVAGVAKYDVPTTRTTVQQKQVGDGNELVVGRFCWAPVVASGAIASGDKLIAAAAGKVAAAGATPDARTIIGEATEAAADGATFWAVIK